MTPHPLPPGSSILRTNAFGVDVFRVPARISGEWYFIEYPLRLAYTWPPEMLHLLRFVVHYKCSIERQHYWDEWINDIPTWQALPRNVRKALQVAQLTSLGAVAEKTGRELRGLRGIGPASVRIIRNVLDKRGYKLKGE